MKNSFIERFEMPSISNHRGLNSNTDHWNKMEEVIENRCATLSPVHCIRRPDAQPLTVCGICKNPIRVGRKLTATVFS